MMSGIESGVAFLGLLFGVILSGLALWNRIARWLDEREDRRERAREKRFKEMLMEVMADRGLVKPGERKDIWPNGSDNMIDFLVTVWDAIEAMEAELHGLKREVRNGN